MTKMIEMTEQEMRERINMIRATSKAATLAIAKVVSEHMAKAEGGNNIKAHELVLCMAVALGEQINKLMWAVGQSALRDLLFDELFTQACTGLAESRGVKMFRLVPHVEAGEEETDEQAS